MMRAVQMDEKTSGWVDVQVERSRLIYHPRKRVLGYTRLVELVIDNGHYVSPTGWEKCRTATMSLFGGDERAGNLKRGAAHSRQEEKSRVDRNNWICEW